MRNKSTLTRVLALSALSTAALVSSSAHAQTATSSLSTSATVTKNCVVSATAIGFGNVDVTTGNAVDGTGGLSVTCTSGTPWSAAANAGSATGATAATRKMVNGADATKLLNYTLYTNDARTTVWGDAVDASKFSGTGSGSAQASTIYGRVLAGQTSLPAGSYADTVTVTVTY